MTLNGAIMQLVELRESSMMPEALKPYFDKVIETISECEEPSIQPKHDENDLDFVQPHKRIPVQLVVSSDCISRQAAIDAFEDTTFTKNEIRRILLELPTAQPERTEIIRCKDCNKASKCYGDVIMRSRGGGNIYCPIEFCSEAERRTDERPD